MWIKWAIRAMVLLDFRAINLVYWKLKREKLLRDDGGKLAMAKFKSQPSFKPAMNYSARISLKLFEILKARLVFFDFIINSVRDTAIFQSHYKVSYFTAFSLNLCATRKKEQYTTDMTRQTGLEIAINWYLSVPMSAAKRLIQYLPLVALTFSGDFSKPFNQFSNTS